MTSVVIPDSVTQIGQCAFMECDISSLTLGKGLTSIAFNTFADNFIRILVIPNGVKTISNSAFYGSSVSITILPTSVTSIGAGAGLGNIYYLGTEEQYKEIKQNTAGLSWGYHYIYMENQPPKYGNYWHYDKDGNGVVW